MNEELKALLKEAYDRGATREQLDAITERYNASKKKKTKLFLRSLWMANQYLQRLITVQKTSNKLQGLQLK